MSLTLVTHYIITQPSHQQESKNYYEGRCRIIKTAPSTATASASPATIRSFLCVCHCNPSCRAHPGPACWLFYPIRRYGSLYIYRCDSARTHIHHKTVVSSIASASYYCLMSCIAGWCNNAISVSSRLRVGRCNFHGQFANSRDEAEQLVAALTSSSMMVVRRFF